MPLVNGTKVSNKQLRQIKAYERAVMMKFNRNKRENETEEDFNIRRDLRVEEAKQGVSGIIGYNS